MGVVEKALSLFLFTLSENVYLIYFDIKSFIVADAVSIN